MRDGRRRIAISELRSPGMAAHRLVVPEPRADARRYWAPLKNPIIVKRYVRHHATNPVGNLEETCHPAAGPNQIQYGAAHQVRLLAEGTTDRLELGDGAGTGPLASSP